MNSVSRWIVCLMITCVYLAGQATNVSQIRGTVLDSTGSAMPGAEVKASQTDTGATRSAITDAQGNYVLPDLTIGPYQLEVTKMGFSRYVQTGIVLQVNVNPTIDVTMRIGAVTDEVSVHADAAMVETQNTSLGQVVDQSRVVDLPLNGRQATDLIFLTPGTTVGRTFRASYPTSVSIAIAGGVVGSVAFMIDGGTNNDGLSNQNLPLPFPDALQEFKVETSALPAQYGYYASGDVNAVTKSGTNTLHGNVFEFLRNGDLNARNTFDAVRDSLKRNQFGGTIGGPIKKDKLFFFLGYQDTIIRSNPTSATQFVPTAAELSGNFSGLAADGCANLIPKTIPAGAPISPIAIAVAAHLPQPTDACGRATFPVIASYTENQGTARVDYQLSAKHTVFGRYLITRLEQPAGSASANLLIADQIGFSDQVQNMTLGDTFVISPRTVNSFRLTGTRSFNTTVVSNYGNLPGFGVQGLYQLPLQKGTSQQYISSLAVSSAFTVATTPAVQPYNTLAFSDDVNLQRGSHQIAFGVNFTNIRAFAYNDLNTNGAFTFNGQGGPVLQWRISSMGVQSPSPSWLRSIRVSAR